MFEKDLSLSVLYDLYGSLLTPAQQRVFESYYGEDFSLAEIAADVGISRQAVRSLLVRASEELKNYEEKLGLRKKNETLKTLCDRLALQEAPEEKEKILAEIREIL